MQDTAECCRTLQDIAGGRTVYLTGTLTHHTHTHTHPSRTVHYHHTTIDTTGHTQHAKQCIFPSPEAHLQGRRGESNRAGALAEVNPFNMEIRPPRHCRREEEKQREAERRREEEKQREAERGREKQRRREGEKTN